MRPLGRRAFLILASLLSPLGVRRAAAQRPAAGTTPVATITVDDFLRLSARLTGRTGLDPDVAPIYLNAFLAVPGNGARLAGLARGAGTHPALEQEIIAAWYTGTYHAGGEARLATHTGALMWSALNLAAPGTCVGRMGLWADPPRTPVG